MVSGPEIPMGSLVLVFKFRWIQVDLLMFDRLK
jgi:hypothetical protein